MAYISEISKIIAFVVCSNIGDYPHCQLACVQFLVAHAKDFPRLAECASRDSGDLPKAISHHSLATFYKNLINTPPQTHANTSSTHTHSLTRSILGHKRTPPYPQTLNNRYRASSLFQSRALALHSRRDRHYHTDDRDYSRWTNANSNLMSRL